MKRPWLSIALLFATLAFASGCFVTTGRGRYHSERRSNKSNHGHKSNPGKHKGHDKSNHGRHKGHD